MSRYFADWNGEQPAAIEPDSTERKVRESNYPRYFTMKNVRWTLKERTALLRGIRMVYRTKLMDQLLEKYRPLLLELEQSDFRKNISVSLPDLFRTKDSPDDTEDSLLPATQPLASFIRILTPNLLSSSSPLNTELLQAFKQDFEFIQHMSKDELASYTPESQQEWDTISLQYVHTKTPMSCFLQWTLRDHPSINKSTWSAKELKRLAEIAAEVYSRDVNTVCSQLSMSSKLDDCIMEENERLVHVKKGPYGWEDIASKHGHGRTAADCLAQYQSTLNPRLVKHRWSAEEDALLRRAVKFYGTGNWQDVALHLEGRTGQQCLHRYTRSLSSSFKRGKWTPEEDEQLKQAVLQIGGHQGGWAKVKELVPGRSDVQCRERWKNVLDPTITSKPWTVAEDARLLEVVAKIGSSKWSLVAQEMDSLRTDNQCARRWKALQKEPKYKIKRRKILIDLVAGEHSRGNLNAFSMPSGRSHPLFDDSSKLSEGLPPLENGVIPKKNLDSYVLDLMSSEFEPSNPASCVTAYPPDPYNIAALRTLWSANSAFDSPELLSDDMICYSEEYRRLLRMFKILLSWPMLCAVSQNS